RPAKLEELLPGDANSGAREALASGQAYVHLTGNAKNPHEQKIAATIRDGYVVALAAVNRRPGRSYDFVKDITDFTENSANRKDVIPVLYRVYRGDGLVNNGIN